MGRTLVIAGTDSALGTIMMDILAHDLNIQDVIRVEIVEA